MRTVTTTLSGFSNYPRQQCRVERPSRYRELVPHDKSVIVRGNGRSYGDAALNQSGTVISTASLNRILAFDRIAGLLTAEAGVLLNDILPVIVQAGWFLPVTPGTRYVTLGGCVAADVHGKNHHHIGSFGNHIKWIDLIDANGNQLRCSPDQSADVFWATIGGMGLTGIIGTVCLKLCPIESSYLIAKHYEATHFETVFEYLNDPQKDDHYSVAWLDLLVKDKKFGRGIVMTAHHAQKNELPTSLSNNPLHYTIQPSSHSLKSRLLIALAKPFLNRTTLSVFNNWYYSKQASKQTPYYVAYDDYFYPLDKLSDWNHLYGKQGFVQYQCVLPNKNAFLGLKELLNKISESHYPVFLAVLKRFSGQNAAFLSFPINGFTLAIDIPATDQYLFSFLDELDDLVIKHEGKVYLAKDARLSPLRFRTMYPRFDEWHAIKMNIDPHGVYNSSLATRLQMI